MTGEIDADELEAMADGTLRRKRGLGKLESRGAVATVAEASGSALIGALALGGLAVGALAIGAMVIGSLGIGRLNIRSAKLGKVEIDDLIVRRLTVLERG